MAQGKKISELTELSSVTDNDEFLFVDKEGSGANSGQGGSNVKIKFSDLKMAITDGMKGEPGMDAEKGQKGEVGDRGIDGGGAAYFDQSPTDGDSIYYMGSGNLGLGTDAPSAKLDVNGDSKFSGSIVSSKSNDNDTLGESGIIVKSANPAISLLDTGSSNGVLLTAKSGGGFDISNATEAEGKTSRFVIGETGNVGIGTDSPVVPLHVKGNVVTSEQMLGGSGAGTLILETEETQPEASDKGRLTMGILPYHQNSNGNWLEGNSFISARTADLLLQPASHPGYSRVGIGGTSPKNKLHVVSDSDNSVVAKFTRPFAEGATAEETSNYESYISVQAGYEDDVWGEQSTVRFGARRSGSTNQASLVLQTVGADRTAGDKFVDRMTIASSGNVGIGTTSPSEKLSIHDSSDPTIELKNSSNNALAAISLVDEGDTNGALAFKTRANGFDPSTRMYINHDGNVGIGTGSPDHLLELNKNGGDVDLSFHDAGAIKYTMGIKDGSQSFQIAEGGVLSPSNPTAVSATRFLIDTNGNVGIGTDAPSFGKLVVQGQYNGSGSDGVGLEFNTSADKSSIESYVRAGQGAGVNEGIVGAMPLSIRASSIDIHGGVYFNNSIVVRRSFADNPSLASNSAILNVVDSTVADNHKSEFIVLGNGNINQGGPQHTFNTNGPSNDNTASSVAWSQKLPIPQSTAEGTGGYTHWTLNIGNYRYGKFTIMAARTNDNANYAFAEYIVSNNNGALHSTTLNEKMVGGNVTIQVQTINNGATSLSDNQCQLKIAMKQEGSSGSITVFYQGSGPLGSTLHDHSHTNW